MFLDFSCDCEFLPFLCRLLPESRHEGTSAIYFLIFVTLFCYERYKMKIRSPKWDLTPQPLHLKLEVWPLDYDGLHFLSKIICM